MYTTKSVHYTCMYNAETNCTPIVQYHANIFHAHVTHIYMYIVYRGITYMYVCTVLSRVSTHERSKFMGEKLGGGGGTYTENLSTTDTLGPIKCVLISEMSSFQGANSTYKYEVGTWSSVLIREVSLIQRCPLRGVPLYTQTIGSSTMGCGRLLRTLQYMHSTLPYQAVHFLLDHSEEGGSPWVSGVNYRKVEEVGLDLGTEQHLPEDLCCSAVQGNNV